MKVADNIQNPYQTQVFQREGNRRTNCNPVHNRLSQVLCNEIIGIENPYFQVIYMSCFKSQEGQFNLKITHRFRVRNSELDSGVRNLYRTFYSSTQFQAATDFCQAMLLGTKGSCGISGWWSHMELPPSKVGKSLDRLVTGRTGASKPWKELGWWYQVILGGTSHQL